MIPDYQTLMLPVLKIIADGTEHRKRDLIEKLALEFKLTNDERKEMLPSGQQAYFDNRVGWAATYLKKAGLIDSPKRATYAITSAGRKALQLNPERIDNNFLRNYPSFIEFISVSHSGSDEENVNTVVTSDLTPEEVLEGAYSTLRETLANDLLRKVMELSPSFFERLVVELLVGMGYGGTLKDAGEAIGKSGDGGVDGIIKEDKLGLDVIYIQAKRWHNNIGSGDIRDFIGALDTKRARKGVFITTSDYSKEARLTASTSSNYRIILIHGEQLAQLMIDYNIGVSLQQTYEVKKIDSDYFGED